MVHGPEQVVPEHPKTRLSGGSKSAGELGRGVRKGGNAFINRFKIPRGRSVTGQVCLSTHLHASSLLLGPRPLPLAAAVPRFKPFTKALPREIFLD